jgi:hypothetical protein
MILTYAQLEGLWNVAGGNPADASTMAAIALAESGGDTTKINNTAYPNLPGYRPPTFPNLPEYSVGLWQINVYAHTNYTAAAMLEPDGNAAAAVSIRNTYPYLDNWSTYTHKTYLQYLQANVPPGTPPPPVVAGGPGSLNGFTPPKWVAAKTTGVTDAGGPAIPSGSQGYLQGFGWALGHSLPYHLLRAQATTRQLAKIVR